MEYYPRKIEKELDRWLERKEIILIKGPRQSGKTTFLLHLKEKFGGNYITLEDQEALESFEKDPKTFLKRYLTDNRTFLFIDEAQYCKQAGKTLKLFYDLFSDKTKIIVTGSGSFDIKVEIGKYLVGRAIYFELLQLDFEEFLLWKAKDLYRVFIDYKNSIKDFLLYNKKIDIEPVFQQEFYSLLEEYLLFGGFPAVVKEDDEYIKKELLKNLVRTYLEKDIFFFLNIRHLENFRKLLNYLGFKNGSLFEFSSIMRELGMDYKTLEYYVSVLVNTYFISLIPPFYKNLATELKKTKKIYFNDLGLRNSIINNFLSIENRLDKGVLFENFIFNELKRNFGGRINYWRTSGKAEVDFVLHFKDSIVPIEVKSYAGLSRSFVSFVKNYNPKKALVFTEKEFGLREIGKTKIAFIPHFFI